MPSSRRATRLAVHAGAPPPLPEHLAPFASVAHDLQAAVCRVFGRGVPQKRAVCAFFTQRDYPPYTPLAQFELNTFTVPPPPFPPAS